jgi:hypothetical protein
MEQGTFDKRRRAKIKIVTAHFRAILHVPFAVNGGGENGSFRIELMRPAKADHNNIKHQSSV